MIKSSLLIEKLLIIEKESQKINMYYLSSGNRGKIIF